MKPLGEVGSAVKAAVGLAAPAKRDWPPEVELACERDVGEQALDLGGDGAAIGGGERAGGAFRAERDRLGEGGDDAAEGGVCLLREGDGGVGVFGVAIDVGAGGEAAEAWAGG